MRVIFFTVLVFATCFIGGKPVLASDLAKSLGSLTGYAVTGKKPKIKVVTPGGTTNTTNTTVYYESGTVGKAVGGSLGSALGSAFVSAPKTKTAPIINVETLQASAVPKPEDNIKVIQPEFTKNNSPRNGRGGSTIASGADFGL